MKKTAGIFLFTGLVILLLFAQCNQGPSRNNKDEEFSFVFMTDIHVKPELRAAEGFARAIDTINALKPDFVISGGDNVFDALQASYGRADSLYFLYDSLSKQLEMPLYNTIGNHEVFGLYQAGGIDPSHEFYGKKMYENRIGDRYYSFDYKHWHFIILDGIGFTPDRKYVGVIDSLQMEWLKADLEAHKDKPVAVSTHIPLLSVGQQVFGKPTSAFSPSEIITNAKEVRELLEQYNVKLVLQGHLHMLEDILYNGIHYVTGGAVCARWWLGPRNGMEEGFLKIDVSGDTFSWQYIDFKWSLTAP
ncbi:MAG: metallophosphoesterase [Bacteroidales bacterium]|nr:metallophosphoesterase [Bacteroidales bacterium]